VPRIAPVIVAEEVYRRVKAMILDGDLPAGVRIDRRALAETLGVSATPLNEALARLTGERFVERPGPGQGREGEGLYVPLRPAEELAQLFAARAALEGMAARLCVERALAGEEVPELDEIQERFAGFEPPFDAEAAQAYLREDMAFHEAIIRGSGNPVITDIDANLGTVHRSWIRGLVRAPEETLPEHRAIIAAFAARDSRSAQDLVVEHNMKSRAALLREAAASAEAAAPGRLASLSPKPRPGTS